MIEARLTIEMMGQPKKVLMEALENVVKEIKEKHKVEKTYYSEPKKVGKTLHTAFVEFIVSVKDYSELMELVVDYIPSVVEILGPEEITVKMDSLQDSLNDIVTMINAYDRRLKIEQSKNIMFERKMQKDK